MTREEATAVLKEMHDSFDRIHENTNGNIGYEQMTALDIAIEAIRHDVIFEQIKWERDVALQTLEEHGIGLGQKCDAVAVQGEWIDDKPLLHSSFAKQYRCSKCGARRYKDNYCSNCGTRMLREDGEASDY